VRLNFRFPVVGLERKFKKIVGNLDVSAANLRVFSERETARGRAFRGRTIFGARSFETFRIPFYVGTSALCALGGTPSMEEYVPGRSSSAGHARALCSLTGRWPWNARVRFAVGSSEGRTFDFRGITPETTVIPGSGVPQVSISPAGDRDGRRVPRGAGLSRTPLGAPSSEGGSKWTRDVRQRRSYVERGERGRGNLPSTVTGA